MTAYNYDANNDEADLLDSIEDVNLEVPLPLVRRFFDRGMTVLAIVLAIAAIIPLFSVLKEIIQRGLSGLSIHVFTSLPAAVGETNVISGFGNAIQGTMVMVSIASLVSIPLGILTAIFLAEFGQAGWLTRSIRFILTVLSGVPSIVVGVFAYALIVLSTIAGYRGFSALAGSVALMVIMLPIVALSTEEALKLVPVHQRLGSSALGGNRFDTTFRIVLPSALAGITTGCLLAVSRAAGETAPLIFTALFSQDWMTSIMDPVASLPVLIYNYASSPFAEQNAMAWTASLVLLVLVLVTNILSRIATRKRAGR